MRWSGVRISGGSPKIAMTELGRSLLFFCVRRDTEIRTGFARQSRLRAPPPQKCSRPLFRTAPIRSYALLAYLRWVTKNSNDRTWTVVAIFLCPQGHRDSNGVRAAKPLARTALKSVLASSPHRPHPKPCTTRISPVGHQNKHGLHEEAVFVLRRRRDIRTGFARRSRLRAPPSKVLSPPFPHRPYPKLCPTRISPVGHQNKHGLHEEAVFVLRRRREIRTGFARRSRLRAPPSKVLSPRLRTAPIRSPALLAYLRRVCLRARRHRLAGNKRGRCRSRGSLPGDAPPRERVPDDSGEPHYTRQSFGIEFRLSKRRISLRRAGGGLDGRARGVVV